MSYTVGQITRTVICNAAPLAYDLQRTFDEYVHLKNQTCLSSLADDYREYEASHYWKKYLEERQELIDTLEIALRNLKAEENGDESLIL